MKPAAPFGLAAALAGCAATGSDVAALERTLGAHASATAALEQWCAARGFSRAPTITATLIAGLAPAPPPDLRARLEVGADEPLGYRHVRLTCGDRTLSVAHNWFVRARLTPSMNALLDTADTPFGKVAAPMGFTRETLDIRHGGEPGCPAGTVLSQVAMLRLPDGKPLAFLTECYTRATIASDRH